MGVARVGLAIDVGSVPSAPRGKGAYRGEVNENTAKFVKLVSSRPEIEIVMAARKVDTVAGAMRLWGAELAGKNRETVLRVIARRFDELSKMD